LQAKSNSSFWAFSVVKSFKHKIFDFFLKGIVRWTVLNTMQLKGAKSVEKLQKYYRKTDKKSEKIEYLRKIRPYLWGCRASFYRKTTWQVLIFYQKKSFKQHTSNRRESLQLPGELAWNNPGALTLAYTSTMTFSSSILEWSFISSIKSKCFIECSNAIICVVRINDLSLF